MTVAVVLHTNIGGHRQASFKIQLSTPKRKDKVARWKLHVFKLAYVPCIQQNTTIGWIGAESVDNAL